MFKREEKILIEILNFRTHLFCKPLALYQRIVQLRIPRGYLLAIDDQLVNVNQCRVLGILFS